MGVAVGLAMAASAAACGGASQPPSGTASTTRPGHSATATPTSRVPEVLAGMSLRQKVGQLFVPTVSGSGPADGIEVIKKYHPGGFIYFPENLRSPRQTAKLSNGLQRASMKSGIPLMLSTDEEQGIVSRVPYITHFPTNKALASARHPDDDVRAAARVTARELRAIGINQNYAPVADVNINPDNPVIGVRSFGADPSVVARLVGVAVDAYQSSGVAATAKHFPGHGDTDVDSHTGLPVIHHSKAKWEKVDAPPFKAAIAHHVDVIMTAHIVVPGLDDSGDPATMSKTVLTGLLRNELHFTGVITTDSLQMAGAIEKYGAAQAAVHAVEAGADQLLMPLHLGESYRAVLKAVRDGSIPMSRLNDAVTHILRLKEKRGLFTSPYTDVSKASKIVGSAEHKAIAKKVAADVHAGR